MLHRISVPLVALLLLGLAAALVAVAPDPIHAEENPAPSQAVLDLLNARPGEKVADLGCGKGAWTFPLARAVGASGTVYAVDIDAKSLEVVRTRISSEGFTNIEVIQSLPDDPMLPKGSLDAVLLNDVIDYVARDALVGFLSGIRAALAPRGRLIIRDPNGNPDRVIAECYRAGFALVEAKVPLPGAPSRSFAGEWYALKLRPADRQPAILPRLGQPRHHRTRLHLAEELYRADLISREDLREAWQRVSAQPLEGPAYESEARDLLNAAALFDLLPAARIKALETKLGK